MSTKYKFYLSNNFNDFEKRTACLRKKYIFNLLLNSKFEIVNYMKEHDNVQY